MKNLDEVQLSPCYSIDVKSYLFRIYGDSKHCRKILNRAVNAVSDWPEQVCDALIMFERQEGTLETLQSSMKRVEAQMRRVEGRREKERVSHFSAKLYCGRGVWCILLW